ncbi:MAG: hypothetical protein HRU14_15625 [Planctomycetes bacterium]|nr:hypothetical protein [Planctomycetota bacterium]
MGAVPGQWTFQDDVWVSAGSVAGCGGPYHDFLTSPDYIVTAAGEVSLSVDHRHAFEGAMWDAGQLWISVNGGAYADVGKDAFTANGYTDVAIIGNGIAKGESGFGNTSAGHADGSYITTTANLGSFAAGDAVSVRFVALYDDCATGAKPNWEVAGVSSDQMVMSSVAGTANLEVVLIKRTDALSGEKLSVNGTDVAASVATDGSTITITGTATDLMPGTAVATVSYNGQSSSWTFTVPERAINHGDGTITYNGHVAWEWWDGIGGAHPMEALTDNASYPDSPSGATFAPSWNTRTALSGGFEGNGRDNYGGRMSGILTAPETGTYRFFIASDDHGLLRISTDADPANAVSVAEQTGCCNNFEVNDATLSGTVDLVEGNQYYVEALLKEGGGGDWLTIGWRKPSEDIDSAPGGNQEGIPGEYFSSTVRVPALPALSASSSPGDGAVGVAPESTITLSVSNGATTLDVASVSISLDGTKLDHAVAEGSWSRDFAGVSQEGATYSITAATGALGSGSEHAVSISFKDSAGAETTIESGFTVTDVMVLFAEAGTVKYIEVEDFNYDGGSYKTFEEVGLGGSYDGLGAVSGIDFNNSGNASEKYRVIPGNHPGMTESMWDAGRNGFDMTVDFKMGWNDDGDWYNYTRDFPEGGSYAVYGRFSSGGAAIDAKLSIVTGDATAADQATEDVGTFTGPATGGWDTMRFFPLNDASGALAVVELSGVTTVRLSKVAGNMDANYLAFVPYEGSDDPVDISMPGDAVVPTSDNHPAGEHAGLAIDNNAATKYLNFDGANDNASGLTITTGGGVVTGLGLTSANDAPDRDPATFVLSGSNDGATFAEIASGDVPGFLDRFERRTVSFDNDVAYTTYQLIFPTTAGPSTCCMQIAEVQLLAASDSRSTTIASSFSVRSYHLMTRVAAGSVSYIEAEDFNYDGGSYKTFEEVGTGGSY